MKHQITTLLVSALLLPGCAINQDAEPPVTVSQMNQAMETQSTELDRLVNQRCEEELVMTKAHQERVMTELTGMVTQLTAMNAGISGVLNSNAQLAALASGQGAECQEVLEGPLANKMILGAVEKVYIQEVGASFDARVDTGAASSSISAVNIRDFERDGDKWVRFDVPSLAKEEGAPPHTVEAMVTGEVRIKKGTAEGVQTRPVIRVRIKLGDYETETDFNLTDRSHLEYPVLLGRKFFKDVAVVDVSREFIQSAETTALLSQ